MNVFCEVNFNRSHSQGVGSIEHCVGTLSVGGHRRSWCSLLKSWWSESLTPTLPPSSFKRNYKDSSLWVTRPQTIKLLPWSL